MQLSACAAAGAGVCFANLQRRVASNQAGPSGRSASNVPPDRFSNAMVARLSSWARGRNLVASAAADTKGLRLSFAQEEAQRRDFERLHRDLQQSRVFGPLLQSLLEWDAGAQCARRALLPKPRASRAELNPSAGSPLRLRSFPQPPTFSQRLAPPDLCLCRQERNPEITVRYALLTTLGYGYYDPDCPRAATRGRIMHVTHKRRSAAGTDSAPRRYLPAGNPSARTAPSTRWSSGRGSGPPPSSERCSGCDERCGFPPHFIVGRRARNIPRGGPRDRRASARRRRRKPSRGTCVRCSGGSASTASPTASGSGCALTRTRCEANHCVKIPLCFPMTPVFSSVCILMHVCTRSAGVPDLEGPAPPAEHAHPGHAAPAAHDLRARPTATRVLASLLPLLRSLSGKRARALRWALIMLLP